MHTALLALVASFSLTACQESALGSELCSFANIEDTCGIPESQCLEALRANGDFVEKHLFAGPSVTLGEGNRCILEVGDIGKNGVLDDDSRGTLKFDVGEATAEGSLRKDASADDDDEAGEGEAGEGEAPKSEG